MTSIFNQIRRKEVEGQDVIYEDKKAFILLSKNPHTTGHSLIIPIEEVGRFEELPTDTFTHMSVLSQKYAKVLQRLYSSERVGIAIDGFEVDHVHMHIMPTWKEKGGVWKKGEHTDEVSFDELKKESDRIKSVLPNYLQYEI